MTRLKALLVGAGLGAGWMFALDPQAGRRRRALVRDKLVRLRRILRDELDVTRRDLANRTRGMAAEARGMDQPGPVSDDTLCERIRARLGQYVSHPGAIDVEVMDGHVVLEGPILAVEHAGAVAAVRRMRGVHAVEDGLEPHATPDIPALVGGQPRTGPRFALFQDRWAPATRALVSLAATGALAAATRRGRATRALASTIGMAMLMRSLGRGGSAGARH